MKIEIADQKQMQTTSSLNLDFALAHFGKGALISNSLEIFKILEHVKRLLE